MSFPKNHKQFFIASGDGTFALFEKMLTLMSEAEQQDAWIWYFKRGQTTAELTARIMREIETRLLEQLQQDDAIDATPLGGW